MKSLGQRWSFACVVASLAAWLGVTSPASAQVPRTMTVQGILRDASGVPVEAATTLRFELLDGETAVWTEQQSVTPRAGLFTVRLGAETPLDPADFANALALRISVDGEAMAPIPLSTVPYAFRAETVDAYDGDVAWGQLTGVPAGFADGTDDGASYAAGAGLTLTGDTFAVDASTVQTRVTGACMPGSSIRAIAEDGTVTCEADDEAAAGASYEAGEGLLLMGTTFSIDTSTVQARVSGTCAPGSAIRSIGSDGTVICEADDVGPSYTAGAGLTLTGTTFSVDTSAVQARVSGTCAAGSSVRSIGSDGTVICEADDVGPSYTAGAGLALTGTTFSVDPALVQVRVSGTCLPGSSVRAIGADGTVTCEADDVGPTYAAGTGLTLMGTTLSVDATAIQARVNATCPVGSSIRAIGPDGSVTCQTDASTSYSAGTGLTLTGTTFTPDTTYLQRRVAASCTAGAAIRAIAADGTVTCEPMPTGGGNGRNLIAWGSDPSRFTLTPATPNRTVTVNNTPSEIREGDASFTLSSTTIAEPGVIVTYGDLIPVDPNVIYEGRISAKALVGSTIGSDFTGYFSAGFVPYNSARVQLTGNAGTNAPTVNGLACSTFLASGVPWTSFSASTFTNFNARVSGEGSGLNQFPVGTRFIRPCVGTNIVGIGRTVIDSFEIYGRSRMSPVQNSWTNGTTGAAGTWVTIPGSTFTATTSGGPLLINMNLFVNSGSHITCRPIVDGAWAGSFGGLPSAGFWFEGLAYGQAGNWIPWASSRLYPGIPAGSHTFAAQCNTDGGTGGYCNAASVSCSMNVIELD